MPHITVGIPTKDRYEQLPLTLVSVINQTRRPDKLIIYDDSTNAKDLRGIQAYQYLFMLMNAKGIEFEVMYGQKRGQHIGHQFFQEKARELVWRIDDDEVAEPNVLEILESHFKNQPKGKRPLGAVAGLVIVPDAPKRMCLPNTIASIDTAQNCQWYRWDGIKECEHLYSSYLYKKGIHNFEQGLSPIAHREETLHSYGIFQKKYRLLVDGSAVTYHFRSNTGGIRASGGQQDGENDERLFRERMREYGIGVPKKEKCFVLDCGMGDHILFKSILPQIKEKYKDYKIILYVCYPEVLKDEGLEMRSIADAHAQLGNLDRFNVFRWCIDNKWDKEMKYAYAKFCGVDVDESFSSTLTNAADGPIVFSKGVRPLRNGNRNAKEYPYWDKLIEMLSKDNEVVEVVKEPLDELEKTIKRAKHVICVDSFLQHFCWYKGVKATALWGTSNPDIFGHKESNNLLKNKGYLRHNQFDMWEGDPYNPNAFVTPEEVIAALSNSH